MNIKTTRNTMTGRITIGAMVVGLMAGGAVGLLAMGGARVGEAQQAPRIRSPQEPTPRGQAAREIAEILREGVEVDPQEVIDTLPSLEDLATRRSEIAEELMEYALVKFIEPPSPTGQRGTFYAAIDDYIMWASRRLDSALDLAESDDDRRNALAQGVAKIRRIEAIFRELTQSEVVGVTPQNLLSLEFERLTLETRLARFLQDSAG